MRQSTAARVLGAALGGLLLVATPAWSGILAIENGESAASTEATPSDALDVKAVRASEPRCEHPADLARAAPGPPGVARLVRAVPAPSARTLRARADVRVIPVSVGPGSIPTWELRASRRTRGRDDWPPGAPHPSRGLTRWTLVRLEEAARDLQPRRAPREVQLQLIGAEHRAR